MESFSLIWCLFLLLIVRFLVWKVGGCLLLTIKVVVLFEKGLRPDSTASACKLPYSLCSYVWSPNSTKKEWFMRLWLLLLLMKSVSSKTNLWSLEDLVISSRYCKITVNCKRKFDCGAENYSFVNFTLSLLTLTSQIFTWIAIKRGIEVWGKRHFLFIHNRGVK